MNKIDEIALRVAETKYPQLPEECMDFLHDVLAELSKDAEPGSGKALSEKMKLLASNACWAHSAPHNEPVNAEVLQELYALIDQVCIELDSPPAPVIASEQKPLKWTPGPNVWKDWCSQWFGPDSDDAYLAKAVFALPPMARVFKYQDASPPNTADIEQRVAEAIAKMLEADANTLASVCGYEDMGSLSFGTGAHAEIKMGRYNAGGNET